MLVIMSTNGPWDSDMLGVVGTSNLDQFGEFVVAHAESTNVEYDMTDPMAISLRLNEVELDVITDGKIERLIEIGDPDSSDLYVAVSFGD